MKETIKQQKELNTQFKFLAKAFDFNLLMQYDNDKATIIGRQSLMEDALQKYLNLEYTYLDGLHEKIVL